MDVSIKFVPEPKSDLDTASIEELRAEVLSLRTWCSNTFLQVKEWTTRMDDLATNAEQAIALRGSENNTYVLFSNKLNELDTDIQLIMQALGLDEGEPNA